VTAATTAYYATVFAQLGRKGRPIPTNDLWLAATAMEHGAVLLTHDKHFNEVDGLLVVRQAEDMLP
jgi:Predicted nucleic acid-binding protein, contains PIN domain